MKYYFPDNFFARFFANSFSENEKKEITYLPSAQLSNELEKEGDAIALIPTMDLLKHEEFFVSKLGGVSFESEWCNSYLYYPKEMADRKQIDEIILAGDVSSNEAVLGKILFAELYDQQVKISLHLNPNEKINAPMLLVGDTNFTENRFESGMSFADDMIEVISAPYVNFIFASKNKESLEAFNSSFKEKLPTLYDSIVPYISALEIPEESKEKIREEFSSFVFEFDTMDIDGIAQVTRLPYFHGMIKEILELKFV